MTIIEIPDNQATALKAKAAAQGLTLKAWLGKLAEESPDEAPRKPLTRHSRNQTGKLVTMAVWASNY
jgi:hypothetical protein